MGFPPLGALEGAYAPTTPGNDCRDTTPQGRVYDWPQSAARVNVNYARDLGWRVRPGSPGHLTPGDCRLSWVIIEFQKRLDPNGRRDWNGETAGRQPPDGRLGPVTMTEFMLEVNAGTPLGREIDAYFILPGARPPAPTPDPPPAPPPEGCTRADVRVAPENTRSAASLGWRVRPGNPHGLTGPGDCRLVPLVRLWAREAGLPFAEQSVIGRRFIDAAKAAITLRNALGRRIAAALIIPGAPDIDPAPGPTPDPGPRPEPRPDPAACSNQDLQSAGSNGATARSLGWRVRPGNPHGLRGEQDCRLVPLVKTWARELPNVSQSGVIGRTFVEAAKAAITARSAVGRRIAAALIIPGAPNIDPAPGPDPGPDPGPKPDPKPDPDPPPGPNIDPFPFKFDPVIPKIDPDGGEGGGGGGLIVASLIALGVLAIGKRARARRRRRKTALVLYR